MAKVNWALQNFDAPLGSVVAGINVTATDDKGNHFGTVVTPDALTATLALDVGTYTITAQAQDGATPPNPLGPIAVDPDPLVIAAPATVTIQVPTNVTAEV